MQGWDTSLSVEVFLMLMYEYIYPVDIFSLWNSTDQVLTYTAYFTMYTTKYKFVLMTLKFYFDCLTDIKIIGS